MMNFDRVYQRVTASYATGIRGDIAIADFQRLEAGTAHVLLEYEPKLGKLSQDDVERYFAKTFESKIIPVMASCSIKKNAVSVIAKMNLPVRPVEDSEDKTKMTPIIAGVMFLDNKLQDHWEVQTDQEGKKVLSKTTKENIEQIIAARRNRMFVTRTPSVSLASLAVAKEHLGAGDIVRAYHKGDVVKLEITERIKGGFKGKLEDGREAVVAKESVTDLMAKQASEAPKEDAKLIKYFEEAYGDKKYAKELVKQ
jgi:hypothetical protein